MMSFLKQVPVENEFVVITLVESKGSVPQVLGAKAVIDASGLIEGTIGGGKVEAKAILFAQKFLQNKAVSICQLVTWNLTRDVGMTCGGVVTFLFEIYRNKKWKVVVFGAGHVAQELVPLLTKLDCHVTCIDSREEWLSRFEPKDNLKIILSQEPQKTVKDFSTDCYFVLMTQGHATDLPILAEILKTHNAPYVGVIGSHIKSLNLRENLKNLNFDSEKIQSFFCPIGLKFGDRTPVEISYSVVAQLLQIRDLNNNIKISKISEEAKSERRQPADKKNTANV